METKLTSDAVRDKEELSETEWVEIKSKIKQITNRLSHKDLKLVPNPFLSHSIWQLTVDEENTNHRAYLDVRDGKTVVIAIWGFDFTHQGDDHWEELEKRL